MREMLPNAAGQRLNQSWNAQDQIMLGAAFYNTAIPERKLEWMLMPMYGFNSGKLVGVGDLKYNVYAESSFFRKVQFGYNFKSFSSETTESTMFYGPDSFTKPTVITSYDNWLRHEVSMDMELNNGGLRNAKHSVLVRGVS